MHQVLRDVFAEWNRLRGDHIAPERAALTPANIPAALPDVLVLAFDTAAGHPIRLAGSRVCALFGGELRGRRFSSLFAEPADRDAMALVNQVADSQLPTIAALTGAGLDHGPLPLELLLLPLRVEGNARARLLGVLATASLPWWLIADPIRVLALGRTHALAAGGVVAEGLPARGIVAAGLAAEGLMAANPRPGANSGGFYGKSRPAPYPVLTTPRS